MIPLLVLQRTRVIGQPLANILDFLVKPLLGVLIYMTRVELQAMNQSREKSGNP
jgi:hypothetical protein